MANLGESFSPDIHCVFVETNLDTRLAVLVHKDDTISHFKDNFCKEHKQSFPESGEIRIFAVKVKRGDYFYHFPDSMIVSKVFEGNHENWCIDVDVDVVKVEKCDLLITNDADQNRSENDLSERGKEIANCSKMKSRMKYSVGLNETDFATTSSRYGVDGSHEICGKVQVDAVASESCDLEKLDHPRGAAAEQVLEKGEKIAELVKIDQEKDLASAIELVDGHRTLRDAVNERDEATLVASGEQNVKPIEVLEKGDRDFDGEIDGEDLARKVEDTATEKISVQNVEKSKKQIKDQEGEVDQYASGAEGVDKGEVKIKKRLRKSEKNKNSCEDHKTDNMDEKKDDVSVPRNEEEPEFDREKLETCLSSAVLMHNNVVQEVSSLEPRVLSRCSCEGQRTRKLVVFDLNGILADVVQEYTGPFVPDGKISNRSVFRRPFLSSFLDFCLKRFDIGIWSSRRIGLDYMTKIVMGDHARNLLFSFDQHICTTTKFNTLEKSTKPLFLKDLKRVWNHFGTCFTCGKQIYDETNTLLVDDSPNKALCNPPHTGIFPWPYQYTDREDSALGPDGELRKYLERLVDVEDVQKFVEENPIGQTPITETHESWEFYSKVIKAYK